MPSKQEYLRALQLFQSLRLQRDHSELAAEPQFQQLGKFFFNEMYGPRDATARNEQARRLHRIVHLLPGLAAHDVQPALALLELTDRLDHAVVRQLVAIDAPADFDEPTYEWAYRLADNYHERVEQLVLIDQGLRNVHRMGRNELLGNAFERTRGMAQLIGMGDIHRFLRVGYFAILPVRDIERFITTVITWERKRLDRIYER